MKKGKDVNYEVLGDGDVLMMRRFVNENIRDTIPPAIYDIAMSEERGMYLKLAFKKFTVPKKIYGSINNRMHKVLHAWDNLPDEDVIGVMCNGLLGTGKTLMIKSIANGALKRNLPVIRPGNALSFPTFINFMDVLGDCCIYVDEFDKVLMQNIYGSDTGSINTNVLEMLNPKGDRRLALFSSNSIVKDNRAPDITGRPGRFRYVFNFDSLDGKAISSIVNKLGSSMDADRRELTIAKLIELGTVNYDTVKALVQEMILYPVATPDELVLDLNVLADPVIVISEHSLKVLNKDIEKVNVRYVKIDNRNASLPGMLRISATCTFKPPKEEKQERTNTGLRLSSRDGGMRLALLKVKVKSSSGPYVTYVAELVSSLASESDSDPVAHVTFTTSTPVHTDSLYGGDDSEF